MLYAFVITDTHNVEYGSQSVTIFVKGKVILFAIDLLYIQSYVLNFW